MRSTLDKPSKSQARPCARAPEPTTALNEVQSLVRPPSELLALQRMIAPNITSRPSLHAEVAAQVENATGRDLASVEFTAASPKAAAAGVDALTSGREVHLGASLASRPLAYQRHVIGHELAHVVQQGSGLVHHGQSTAARAALEEDAETVAHRAGSLRSITARPLLPLGPVATGAVQHFDPRYHRRALIHGLAESEFSNKQIGQIYAADWERDFSQAHPLLGNVVIRWKSVKVAAMQNNQAVFNTAGVQLKKAISELLTFARKHPGALRAGKSYDGYRFYDHFDNPVAPDYVKNPYEPEGIRAATAAKLRAIDADTQLPNHILFSRDHIKARLAFATSIYRNDFHNDQPTAEFASDFHRRAQALEILNADVTKGALPVSDPNNPQSEDALRTPIVAETAKQALTVRKSSDLNNQMNERFTPYVADSLGSASHALEDFFSHSTFVELALGEETPGVTGLNTGTFEAGDSLHSLSHKLRGLSDDMDINFELVAAAADGGPIPDGEVDLASETLPQQSPMHKRSWLVKTAKTFNPILTGLAEGIRAATNSKSAATLLINDLHEVSETLESASHAVSRAGSHTRIAKDQPGHDPDNSRQSRKTKKFHFAQACAIEAVRMTIGEMPSVFLAKTPNEANTLLTALFAQVDRLIAPPSSKHPLAATIAKFTAL